MQLTPTVTLSSERAAQGSVVAIQLSGILDGEPSLETDLGSVWFRKTASGYMGYIPVTYNAESGDHVMTLTCGSLTRDVTLSVSKTEYGNAGSTGGGGLRRCRGIPQRHLAAVTPPAKAKNSGRGLSSAPARRRSPWPTAWVQMVDGQRSGQATGLTYAASPGETITAPPERQGGLCRHADAHRWHGGH